MDTQSPLHVHMTSSLNEKRVIFSSSIPKTPNSRCIKVPQQWSSCYINWPQCCRSNANSAPKQTVCHHGEKYRCNECDAQYICGFPVINHGWKHPDGNRYTQELIPNTRNIIKVLVMIINIVQIQRDMPINLMKSEVLLFIFKIK